MQLFLWWEVGVKIVKRLFFSFFFLMFSSVLPLKLPGRIMSFWRDQNSLTCHCIGGLSSPGSIPKSLYHLSPYMSFLRIPVPHLAK